MVRLLSEQSHGFFLLYFNFKANYEYFKILHKQFTIEYVVLLNHNGIMLVAITI